ncbi:MAG TPA: nuclease-related domain-containing protein [Methanoregula sp.]|nr:nuclease-related domain-containing protein [Methanoregula sp.]
MYSHILEINSKIESTKSFLPRTAYVVQFWIAHLLSSYRINHAAYGAKWDLKDVRSRKARAIAEKPQAVKNSCRNIIETKRFLDEHGSYLAGAFGEEQVIRALSLLPDDFHILNDVNIHFREPVYWKKYQHHIRNCQIDHIVVGPTGLFMLETKNWSKSNMGNRSDDLIFQINRANYALWYYLKDHYWRNETPRIYKIAVSTQGFVRGQKSDPYIEAITPDRLSVAITGKNGSLSKDAIDKLVRLIPFRETS